MLRTLLAKDLRRAWRNPLPWLINLAMPLLITALIGLAFGRGGDAAGLGRIRFALVDEDDSTLTQFLRGALNQGEGAKHLEAVFLSRDAALREIEAGRLSAALVLPRDFTRDFLTGRVPVTLELVKNPAQSIHPAVIEEGAGLVVTALNALARNFQPEFPDWQEVFEGRADHRRIADLVVRAGDKVQALRAHLAPPLVTYGKEVRAGPQEASASGRKFNLFGYLLAGLAAMFMLFLASTALLDLQRELRLRTFQRFHTLHHRLGGFLTAKIAFAMVTLMLCAAVMLGGGGLIFRIDWQHPWTMAALAAGYAWFCAGFMAALLALMPDEHRAGTLSNIAGMAIGLAGGCAFPPQQLPDLIRLHVTPLLPSYWFGETVRALEFGSGAVNWPAALLKLALAGAVCLAVAAWLYRRRFARGIQ